MSSRFLTGLVITIIYIIILVLWVSLFMADYEVFYIEDIIVHGVLFCGLLPLITILAVLKFKKKDEYLKSTECVIFIALLLHYFYAVNAAHANLPQTFLLLLLNVLITSIMMFIYIRKQRI